MPRIHGQRCEHGEDPLLEGLDEELLVVVVEVVPARQPDAHLGQRRGHRIEEQTLLTSHKCFDSRPHLDELLGRWPPVRRWAADPRGHLLLEARYANLEELVEVLAEDGQELGALEQGDTLVLRQREHALVEVEPRQLTIEVADLVSALVRPCHGADRTDVHLAAA